jgi:hypothetical protein
MFVGGLVGLIEGGGCRIEYCYASGAVFGVEGIGGLVGTNWWATITNCYSGGSVTGENYMGGLVGKQCNGTIQNCYSSTLVKESEWDYGCVGGLLGCNGDWSCSWGGTVSRSFWDIEASGQATSDGGDGKTTAEMKTISTFLSRGWDFVDEQNNGKAEIWWMYADGFDYPRLSWETIELGYSAGSGEPDDPYQIASVDDWLTLTRDPYHWHKHFILLQDIDFGGIFLTPVAPDIEEHRRFGPLIQFTGSFDGRGHVLRNAALAFPGQDYVGLFGRLDRNGEVKNLRIENIAVTGKDFVGGLCAYNVGMITECHVAGVISNVTGKDFVGGLCAENGGTITGCSVDGVIGNPEKSWYLGGLCGINYGTLSDCRAAGTVNGGILSECIGGVCGANIGGEVLHCVSDARILGGDQSRYLGGLCGGNNGLIHRCSATGDILGGNSTGDFGGLCGFNSDYIHESSSTGNVLGGDFGGFVGYNDGVIRDCFATGSVRVGDDAYGVGGFCGENYRISYNEGEIYTCYATGSVTSGPESEFVGGLCGRNEDGYIERSFWDIETSGLTNSDGGTGRTTAEMKFRATYLKEGWDFETIWRMPMNAYPRLDGESVDLHYSGGSGTAEDPYKIATAADWQVFMNDPGNWDKNFILVETIDFGGAKLASIVFNPFGDFSIPFTGVFDGQGNTLRNAVIDMPGSYSVGLFGYLASPGLIQNLGMVDISVTGVLYVGGLCGVNGNGEREGGTITGCFVTGTVSGISVLGGLCGRNFSGTINGCSVTGTVNGGDDSGILGGLCGFNTGKIGNCYAAGAIQSGEGSYDVGGLCGYNYGQIYDCYATSGIMSGKWSYDIGGVCGFNSGTIGNCYAAGTIQSGEGSFEIGGLCGYNYGQIHDCYATGRMMGGEGSYDLGGFCGYNDIDGVIRDCFWDIEASGQTTSAGGEGKTTAQMKTLSTFTVAGWDFVGEAVNGTADVWRMCADGVDYPRLSWEYAGSGDFACPNGVGMEDLLYLAERWIVSTPETIGAADGNGDGKVNLEDFGMMGENWGRR